MNTDTPNLRERLGRAAWEASPVRGPYETWDDLPDVGRQAWIRIGQAVLDALAEQIAALELERDEYRHANALAAQAYIRIEAQLTVLQDASRPAATILFTLAQQPGIDPQVVATIQQTLAPLEAALAAKASE